VSLDAEGWGPILRDWSKCDQRSQFSNLDKM